MSCLNWATVLDEGNALNALNGLALAQVPQIKCWEVGYGTTIEDAIENVELLRQDSANSVPYSPAYLSHSLSRTTSLDQPGARSSQQPAEVLSRRLFHAAQEAMLEEQRRVGVVTVTEEEAGVVGVGGNAPKTPIAGRARGDGNGAGRGAIRHWDGTGTGSTFRLRFADSVFATIHLHLANAMADGGGDEGDEQVLVLRPHDTQIHPRLASQRRLQTAGGRGGVVAQAHLQQLTLLRVHRHSLGVGHAEHTRVKV